MPEQNCYNREDFYHHIVAPIDSWDGFHLLSAIRNREGDFVHVDNDFIHDVVSICNELREGLGALRHPPYIAFDPLLPGQQPRISRIYMKEDENGVTHIFSIRPLDIVGADSSPGKR